MRIALLIIVCVIFFIFWMFLQWLVLEISPDYSKKSNLIILFSMVSSLCAFMCGIFMVMISMG